MKLAFLKPIFSPCELPSNVCNQTKPVNNFGMESPKDHAYVVLSNKAKLLRKRSFANIIQCEIVTPWARQFLVPIGIFLTTLLEDH